MAWSVVFHSEFVDEARALSEPIQQELAARLMYLRTVGPALGRPFVDTLKGSKHANMKELRFEADGGVWRVAFAFDPARDAIVLVAGDKGGVGQRKFYVRLIKVADKRYADHLKSLKQRPEK